MSKTMYDTLRETALAYVAAYESSPKAFDPDRIVPLRTQDAVHHLHPAESIPSPFDQPIAGEHFVNAMNFFGACIARLEFQVKDMVVDVETRTVVVRVHATFDFKAFGSEAKEENFTAEYMWLTEMNEAGLQVKRVEEFLDPMRLTQYVKDRATRYAEWQQSQQS